jgi:hypothetical protein
MPPQHHPREGPPQHAATEEVLREFLGERPGTAELQEMLRALRHRLAGMEKELAAAPSPALERRVLSLRRQVEALREEALITEFVEDSVRVTLAMGQAAEILESDPEVSRE